MNKEYKIIDGKVIVLDELKRKSEREITNNIKEILVCENNIEEIENLITNEENNINHSKQRIKTNGYLYLFLSFIWGITAFSNMLLCNMTWISNLLCCVLWAINGGIFVIKYEKKHIKTSENSINILQEQLKIEQEKLNELNKNKENNALYIPEKEKNISTSKIISNLKDKLFIIKDYSSNKNTYKKAYKTGNINKNFRLLYTDEEIELVKELLKNDFPNEFKDINNLEKNSVKQKSKKL